MPYGSFHCHSRYSSDSSLSLEAIIVMCQEREITAIALTDHNTIAGAVELSQRAPEWLQVIIGEEISSNEGHVIGLFLREEIAPGLSIQETITRIRAQDGIVVLPHAFDSVRKGSTGPDVTQQITKDIDYLEIYNSRCLRRRDNDAAATFATTHNIAPIVGADAHFASELGNALCELPPFTDAISFRNSMREARFHTRPAGWVAHARSLGLKHSRWIRDNN